MRSPTLLAGMLAAAIVPAAHAQSSVTTTPEGNRTALACGLDHDPGEREFGAFPPARRTELLTCFQGQIAQALRAKLPMKVDDSTELRAVSADGVTLRYAYAVDADAATFPAETRQAIGQYVRDLVCKSGPMAATIRMGGAYAYRWEDRKGEEIFATTISAC